MQLCRSVLRLQYRTFSSGKLRSTAHASRLQMPGFNESLNTDPKEHVSDYLYYRAEFPNALDVNGRDESGVDVIFTYREILMMRIMNAITDKPQWERKVFDESITHRWRQEIAQSGQDVSLKMMDWIIKELQWKAGILEKESLVEVFDNGVIKSDTAVFEEVKNTLKQAVIPLEDIPEQQEDYHPGSDNKVVNLVHPPISLPSYNCLDNFGEGKVLPTSVMEPEDGVTAHIGRYPRRHPDALSNKFQWLPCDVEWAESGKCQILSYINNAHPVQHRAVYQSIERVLTQTFPLWERSLADPPCHGKRIAYDQVEYLDGYEEPELGDIPDDPVEEEKWHKIYDEWWESREIKQPEPGEFRILDAERDECINLRKAFPDRIFQVIVKLANIELTPGKPPYEGETWHIEGQLNERIAASAIYYYDSNNTTDSSLAFRHRAYYNSVSHVQYEQDQHQFMEQVYGFQGFSSSHRGPVSATQELGSVLCKEGRLITFANTLQHRVSPFSLADKSKPGHRKILALFLVDPHRRISSSANVPPQREDWQRMVARQSANETTMTMEEAKAYRLELMKECGLQEKETNTAFQQEDFSLCEH